MHLASYIRTNKDGLRSVLIVGSKKSEESIGLLPLWNTEANCRWYWEEQNVTVFFETIFPKKVNLWLED